MGRDSPPKIQNASDGSEVIDPVAGEKEFCRAMIRRAMFDAANQSKDLKAKWRENARDWLLSEENNPVTFVWCCEHLDWDVERVRSLVLAYTSQRLKMLDTAQQLVLIALIED